MPVSSSSSTVCVTVSTVSLVTGVCVTVTHNSLDVVVVYPLLVQGHVLLWRGVGRLRPLVGRVGLRFVMGVTVTTVGVTVTSMGVTVVPGENLELETV